MTQAETSDFIERWLAANGLADQVRPVFVENAVAPTSIKGATMYISLPIQYREHRSAVYHEDDT